MGMAAFWSCDLDHLYKLSCPFRKEAQIWALIGQAVSVEKMFENGGHIHVFSPGARTDNPLGSNIFHKQYSLVNFFH